MVGNSGDLQILRMIEERTLAPGGNGAKITDSLFAAGDEIPVSGKRAAAITGACVCTFGKIAVPILSP